LRGVKAVVDALVAEQTRAGAGGEAHRVQLLAGSSMQSEYPRPIPIPRRYARWRTDTEQGFGTYSLF